MKTTGIIYKITNKANGKVYIGQTIQTLARRRGEHLYRFRKENRDHLIYLAFRKYGVDNFKWDVLETCEDLTELNEREVYYIKEYNSYERGYNMNVGGNSVSIETRERLSEIFMGREITWAHRTAVTRKALRASGDEVAYPRGEKHSRSKKYIVTEPNGTYHIVTGLAEWCRNWKKDSVRPRSLIRVAQGERSHTKGYKCQYADRKSATTIPNGSTPKWAEAQSIPRG